jgi:hypothetical protein
MRIHIGYIHGLGQEASEPKLDFASGMSTMKMVALGIGAAFLLYAFAMRRA